jgi:hypothetical protein
MNTKKTLLYVVIGIIILTLGVVGGYFWGIADKAYDVDQAKLTAAQDTLKQVTDNSTTPQIVQEKKTSTDTTCNADELSLASTVDGGAAGTIAYDLILTNTGKRTCTMVGFPGVSLVNDNGNQIGTPAQRATNYAINKINLAPGAKAKAMTFVSNEGNFDPGICHAGATKVRLYPPNDTGYLSVSTPITSWCPGFQISPMTSI